MNRGYCSKMTAKGTEDQITQDYTVMIGIIEA